MAERKPGKGAETAAGAISILVACALGFWLAPFGSPLTSAAILGAIAGISFAARGLFRARG
ncbi:hypothetical protein ACLB6G_06185 [Zhengella sp. ZM62]|uniref:hypothetical protein n=1 Tax=Zhengella sedimenti TaxID=3390035 RepID=UPI0039747918